MISWLCGLALMSWLQPDLVLAADSFVHPGALNTQGNLEFVRRQILAGRAPWSFALRKVESTALADRTSIVQVNSLNRSEVEPAKQCAINAYSNALAWRLTGDSAYKRQAIASLNGWSRFNGFTGGTDQDKLLAGWLGALLGQAAEIMRSSPDWKAEDILALKDVFRRAFYPQLTIASTWNGNVDLTQIDALMALAIFNDDRAEFNLGLQRLETRSTAYFYLRSDKSPPSIDGDGGDVDTFWFHPKAWVDGLTQETCRDNGHHAQFGLASALHGAEMAWNQGQDVYGRQAKRYTAAMELMAHQLLTGDMLGTCANPVTTSDVYDMFEVGYNHYHNRMGLPLPYTERLIATHVRPAGKSDWNIFHETLTHANLPRTLDRSAKPKAVSAAQDFKRQ